jgi:hypothetical protein
VIAFATLWLGIVAGPLPVEVLAGPQVARIELRLDGEAAATIPSPPWTTTLDLGSEIAPHELVARAFDAAGQPLGEARQLLNMPRPAAELELAVSRVEGALEVRLAWAAIGTSAPRTVRASLDGVPLPGPEDLRVLRLPPFTDDRPHLLRIEAEFPGGSTSREVVLGGELAADLRVDLTGVPLEVRGRTEPAPAAVRLLVDGAPLPVVALDRGLADLVAVVDPAAQRALAALAARAARRQVTVGGGGPRGSSRRESVDTRFLAPLGEDHRLRLVLPLSDRDGRYEIFPTSEELSSWRAGLLTYLATPASAEGSTAPAGTLAAAAPRLADAVALAAMTASREGRRRAVLLVAAPESADGSLYPVAAVRRYLARMRVPLVVWTPGEPTARLLAEWGEAWRVDSISSLERAARELAGLLDRQRVAWIEGSHLPHHVALGGSAAGVRLAGGEPGAPGPAAEALAGAAAAAIAERDEQRRLEEAGRETSAASQTLEAPLPGALVTHPLGPFSIATDVRDQRLLQRLAEVAAALAPAYRDRFGLTPQPSGRVLLFGRERAFRAWLAARHPTGAGSPAGGAAPADSGLEGYAASGTAALHADGRSANEVAALLVHELSHLLTETAVARSLPPWLGEGLSEELAMSRLDSRGRVVAGSLRTERTVRAGADPSRRRTLVERTVSGPGAALARLVGTPGARVPLAELLAFDGAAFVHPAGRRERYATAGFFVRFLLAEPDRAARFRAFLAAVAGGAPADAPALTAALGEPLPVLEDELVGWLRRTALSGGG